MAKKRNSGGSGGGWSPSRGGAGGTDTRDAIDDQEMIRLLGEISSKLDNTGDGWGGGGPGPWPGAGGPQDSAPAGGKRRRPEKASGTSADDVEEAAEDVIDRLSAAFANVVAGYGKSFRATVYPPSTDLVQLGPSEVQVSPGGSNPDAPQPPQPSPQAIAPIHQPKPGPETDTQDADWEWLRQIPHHGQRLLENHMTGSALSTERGNLPALAQPQRINFPERGEERQPGGLMAGIGNAALELLAGTTRNPVSTYRQFENAGVFQPMGGREGDTGGAFGRLIQVIEDWIEEMRRQRGNGPAERQPAASSASSARSTETASKTEPLVKPSGAVPFDKLLSLLGGTKG